MKDLILMILQIVVVACIFGVFASSVNDFFGWHIGFKGAEAPADLRAIASFIAAAGVCSAIVYFWGGFGKKAGPSGG
jgi:hypothetical protein